MESPSDAKTAQESLKSDDPEIGQKILLTRRDRHCNQAEVAKFIENACGRARSARWLSSLEGGRGVIYRDEVKALEDWWSVKFSEILVSAPAVIQSADHCDPAEKRIFISEQRDYFRIQQDRLESGDYELWFTSPSNLLFLHDDDIKIEVATTLAKGVHYKFVWFLDDASIEDFRDFLNALNRVGNQINENDPSQTKGKFEIFPIRSFYNDSHSSRLEEEYESNRENLSNTVDHAVFHEIIDFEDTRRLHRLAPGQAIKGCNLCFFLPTKEPSLSEPDLQSLAVLQFAKVGQLEGLDVAAERGGWLLLDKGNTREIESVLRDLNRAVGNHES